MFPARMKQTRRGTAQFAKGNLDRPKGQLRQDLLDGDGNGGLLDARDVRNPLCPQIIRKFFQDWEQGQFQFGSIAI